ncbi:MAG: hypothetical protein ABIO72_03275 [Patescibacteria group bacterium]
MKEGDLKVNKITFLVLGFFFVLTGCGGGAFHALSTNSDPSKFDVDERTHFVNGSQNVEHHCESNVVGGCDGSGGFVGQSTLTVPHPPMRLIPFVDESSAQSAMGDIPGGVVLLHPGALNGVATKRDIERVEGDIDAVVTIQVEDHNDIQKMKKATPPTPTKKKDSVKPKKAPPSKEMRGGPSSEP